MKPTNELLPAPKRGEYDRALSRHERQAAQQDRVVAAIAAIAQSGRALTVANVVERAGIGRNTFYQYFDDVDHALSVIRGRAQRDLALRLEPALELARTPLERIRSLARVWAETLTASPAAAAFALNERVAGGVPGLSALAEYVSSVLQDEVEARDALPGLGDPLRVTAVAAVFDAISRSQIAQQASTSELQRVLADLALRLLR